MAYISVYEDLKYPPFVYRAAGAALVMSPKDDNGAVFYHLMNTHDVLGYLLILRGEKSQVERSARFTSYLQRVTLHKEGENAYHLLMEGAAEAMNKGRDDHGGT